MLMIASEYAPEATRGEVAWQEMVWRQAFNAALATSPTDDDLAESLDGLGDDVASKDAAQVHVHWAGCVADAALVEWKKRWQR